MIVGIDKFTIINEYLLNFIVSTRGKYFEMKLQQVKLRQNYRHVCNLLSMHASICYLIEILELYFLFNLIFIALKLINLQAKAR